MTAIPLRIDALGRYLPARIVTADELDEQLGLESGWVLRKTGVAERRWATDETLLDMAVAATNDALDRSSMTLADLDLLIYAAASPHQAIPDTAALVQRELGLGATGLKAFSVHSTCLSFVTALDIAASHLAAGRHHNILIVSAEMPSLAIDVTEPESAALLGDMATAVLVTTPGEAPSSLRSLVFETYGEGADLCCIEGAGVAKPPNRPSTKPEDHYFHMNGPAIFKLAYRYMAPLLETALTEAGVSKPDLDLVIPHQASLLAVRSIQRAFGVPDEKMLLNLHRYGNCVSASLPGAIYDAVAEDRLHRGDTILLAGTGAGLSLAAVVLTW